MSFDINDAALGIHPQALLVGARRAEVLAANIANADTPGYKARDIDFRAALSGAQSQMQPSTTRLVTTDPAHLTAAAGELPDETLLYRTPSQPSIDGNTVDAQVEYSQFSQNALHYQASLTFLSNRIKNLLTAIRGD